MSRLHYIKNLKSGGQLCSNEDFLLLLLGSTCRHNPTMAIVTTIMMQKEITSCGTRWFWQSSIRLVHMWAARNHHLHHTSSSLACRQLRNSDLLAEIASLHEQAHMVNAGDRHFWERPHEEIVNASSSLRRRWLHYMQKARANKDKKKKYY